MEPFFIAHIRAPSGLPGPLAAGNDAVDKFIAPIFTSAMDEHANLHTNAKRLHSKYHIPLTEARHIIKSCDVCAPLHLRTTVSGVNPHGQQPNSLWQSDFTHCSLGKFSLLFVSVIHFQVLYGQCLSLQNPANTPFPHFYSPSLLWEYLRS